MIKYEDKVFKNENELYNYAITLVAHDCVASNYEYFLNKLKLRIPVREAIVFGKKEIALDNKVNIEPENCLPAHDLSVKPKKTDKPKKTKKDAVKKKGRNRGSYIYKAVRYQSITELYNAMSLDFQHKYCDSVFRKRLKQGMAVEQAIDKTPIQRKNKPVFIKTKDGVIETNGRQFYQDYKVSYHRYLMLLAKGLTHEQAVVRKNQTSFKIAGLGEFKNLNNFMEFLKAKGITVSKLTAWRMAHGKISEKMQQRIDGKSPLVFEFDNKQYNFKSYNEAMKTLGLTMANLKRHIQGKPIKVKKNKR